MTKRSHGISLKKSLGQHFLQDHSVVHAMLAAVELTAKTSILEIGAGSGFLTKEILQTKIKKLCSFEIDTEWGAYLKKNIHDPRFSLFTIDFLAYDLELLKQEPWTILANLPYYITFPILERFIVLRSVITEGVIMIQEEVAQKLVAVSGRSYGASSIFFQYYFNWTLLNKIHPLAFNPPPKVFSRLVYFTGNKNAPTIEKIDAFFKFVKVCFKQPRRMLRNNLAAAGIDYKNIDEKTLNLRAQQMNFDELFRVYTNI